MRSRFKLFEFNHWRFISSFVFIHFITLCGCLTLSEYNLKSVFICCSWKVCDVIWQFTFLCFYLWSNVNFHCGNVSVLHSSTENTRVVFFPKTNSHQSEGPSSADKTCIRALDWPVLVAGSNDEWRSVPQLEKDAVDWAQGWSVCLSWSDVRHGSRAVRSRFRTRGSFKIKRLKLIFCCFFLFLIVDNRNFGLTARQNQIIKCLKHDKFNSFTLKNS